MTQPKMIVNLFSVFNKGLSRHSTRTRALHGSILSGIRSTVRNYHSIMRRKSRIFLWRICPIPDSSGGRCRCWRRAVCSCFFWAGPGTGGRKPMRN